MKIQTQDTHDRRRHQSERDVDNMENLVEAANNHRFDEVDNVENNYDMNSFDVVDVPDRVKRRRIVKDVVSEVSSSEESDGIDDLRSLINEANGVSKVESSPVGRSNIREILIGNNNYNQMNLMDTFSNAEVELKFRNALPKKIDYFHTAIRIDINNVLDEYILKIRNHLMV
ncbi:hypothetical protein DAPK24_030630 [Pichia kluyveri]|uniref:Uncharacterized protein n=1 Tax=Pichia kluyveri TaxID=36015 RepID=A0AAV5R4L6_PICKL|nr:hypothetical protein DAPK24_030630 [Pichia kluyveri]